MEKTEDGPSLSPASAGPSRLGLVISAEHASNALPDGFEAHGLSAATLASHAAWDPGAREVAEALRRAFEVPCFLGQYSRLFVDLNRSPGSREVIPVVAFGVPVPANAGLSRDAAEGRLREHHAPYWTEVENAVRRGIEMQSTLLHVSVHSFTPELDGCIRDLDLGLLYDPEQSLERALAGRLEGLLTARGFDTRPNQPYDGRSDALVTGLRTRFPKGTYAGIELEISHRLLGQLAWVERAIVESIAAVTGLAPRGLPAGVFQRNSESTASPSMIR